MIQEVQVGRVTGTWEKKQFKNSVEKTDSRLPKCVFVHKTNNSLQMQTPILKPTPQLEIFLSSKKAGVYFNIGKRVNFK